MAKSFPFSEADGLYQLAPRCDEHELRSTKTKKIKHIFSRSIASWELNSET